MPTGWWRANGPRAKPQARPDGRFVTGEDGGQQVFPAYASREGGRGQGGRDGHRPGWMMERLCRSSMVKLSTPMPLAMAAKTALRPQACSPDGSRPPVSFRSGSRRSRLALRSPVAEKAAAEGVQDARFDVLDQPPGVHPPVSGWRQKRQFARRRKRHGSSP